MRRGTVAALILAENPMAPPMACAPATPSAMPISPPIRVMTADSARNCRRMEPVRAPRDLRMPDLAGALRNGHQHDVHHADASHKQGDGGDNHHENGDASHHGIDLGDLILHILNHDHALISHVMPAFHEPDHALGDLRIQGRGFRDHIEIRKASEILAIGRAEQV